MLIIQTIVKISENQPLMFKWVNDMKQFKKMTDRNVCSG